MRTLVVLSSMLVLILCGWGAQVAGARPPANEANGLTAAAAEVEYVRLRGSAEVHILSCPLVKGALPEGIVHNVKKDSGPPCQRCLKTRR